jgi:hypothetical protein
MTPPLPAVEDYHLIVLVEDPPPPPPSSGANLDLARPYLSNATPTLSTNVSSPFPGGDSNGSRNNPAGFSEHFLFLREREEDFYSGNESANSVNKILEVFVLTVIALVGILGNLLVAFTLIRRKQLKYPSNR